ncbi:hypothetical protein RQN30_05320 [Arcanobacterium hippocoleae]
MTALLMLHNAKETALVWRRVADSLPALWAVIAPDLHGVQERFVGDWDANAKTSALAQLINADLQALNINEPVVIAAAGNAAAAALHYYHVNPQKVAALFLSEPQFKVSARQISLAKIRARFAFAGKRRKPTAADSSQEFHYLSWISEFGTQSLANVNVPIRLLAAEKERKIARETRQLAAKHANIEYFSISGAESGWNDYAPAQYAANIAEFINQL